MYHMEDSLKINSDCLFSVGKPIHVPKVENPSQELIDEYHEKFLQQLQELFDTYKDKYDPSGSEAKLVITR